MNSDEIINSIIKPFVVEQPYEVPGEFYMSSSSNTKLSFMGECMKNNETTVMVTEDQFYMLKILNKLGLLKITRSWTNGMTYYVTVERKDEN